MTKLLNIGLAILLVSLASTVYTVHAEAPTDQLESIGVEIIRVPSMHELVDIYADKWNISREVLNKTVNCESGYQADNKNLNDKHKDKDGSISVGSWGIAQFGKPTFKTYSEQIGIQNGDPMNPEQALDTMAYMFSKNLGFHWSCYRKST